MPRSRNARGQGSRLREEILDAAAALLDETGDPSSLTLRGIARRAGISAPPIYAHFDDLGALVEAVLAQGFEDLRAEVVRAVGEGSEDEPVRALEAAGAAYVRFAWDHPARYRLMFSAEGYATNSVETFRVVEALIARAAELGVGASTDARTEAWMLWAGLHGVATLEKPARASRRRLGPLDRPAMLLTMIHRLARLAEPTAG